MKLVKVYTITIVIITLLILFCAFGVYVYVGTYVFPIAPYWVTQLPPNPPKPKIEYGEFEFKMVYSIDGKLKEVSDIIICRFNGFEVSTVGGAKKRVWSENIKNINCYELFRFRDGEREENENTYSSICIENIDKFKVVLRIPDAEWFLNEPDYKDVPEMPSIRVYDTQTKYYLEPTQRDVFLKEHNFELIVWFCDEAVKNEYR